MVRVTGSRGAVDVQVKGVAEAMRFLRRKKVDIKDGADAGTFQAANFVQQEVQEDIIGRRRRGIKSVDTGRFGNSITVDKLRNGEYKVFPLNSTYPNGQTVEEVSKILEYGTSISMGPRRHFGATKDRTRDAVRKIIGKEVNLSTKGQLGKFKRGIRFERI